MKKNTLALTIALFAFLFSGIGQEEIIIVDRGMRRERTKKPLIDIENTGVIKFTPTQMFVGELNFSYERQISKNSSFEISAGPTISNISIGDVSNHWFDPWGLSSLHTSRLGMFAEIGYRYYPLEETEALNRFYVSPTMKFKLMNYGISDLSNVLADTEGSDTRYNFCFNIGYQWWMAKTFSMDFYAGMGIGYQQIDDSHVENVFIDPNWTYQWRQEVSTGARYAFNIGVKVGIGHK